MRIARLSPTVVLTLLAGLWIVTGSTPASADTTYNPPSWNGKTVYLSLACHDRGTGACHTNYGCDNFSENNNSRLTAQVATYFDGDRENLLERGYRVIIGDGLLQQNVDNSNAAGAAC